MNARPRRQVACAERGDSGFGLTEVLVGALVALVLVSAIVGMLVSLARTALAHPLSADECQRSRAAFQFIVNLISRAGEGLVDRGPNASSMLVPALYPQRRGVPGAEPDTSASATSITIVSGSDQPRAYARVLVPMTSASSDVVLDPASCGPGRPSCGFTSGTYALLADTRATAEWFLVQGAATGRLTHPALSTTYSPVRFARIAAVEVRTLWWDAALRQLRLSSPASDVPLLDDVEGFRVDWFADPASPRAPLPPAGEENCVISSGGAARLPPLSPTDGAWTRLSVADLSDGPWCGQAPWRFDADLFRVRAVSVQVQWRNETLRASLRLGNSSAPRVRFHIAPANLVGGG